MARAPAKPSSNTEIRRQERRRRERLRKQEIEERPAGAAGTGGSFARAGNTVGPNNLVPFSVDGSFHAYHYDSILEQSGGWTLNSVGPGWWTPDEPLELIPPDPGTYAVSLRASMLVDWTGIAIRAFWESVIRVNDTVADETNSLLPVTYFDATGSSPPYTVYEYTHVAEIEVPDPQPGKGIWAGLKQSPSGWDVTEAALGITDIGFYAMSPRITAWRIDG